jgi:hypothetical protein
VPELSGWVNQTRGLILVHEGRFAEARPILQEAIAWLSTRCKDVPFRARLRAAGYDLNAANHLGEFAEIAEGAGPIVENSLRPRRHVPGVRRDWLCAAQLARAPGWEHGLSRFREAQKLFKPQKNFQWADYLMLMAEISLVSYQGDARRGHQLLTGCGPRWWSRSSCA